MSTKIINENINIPKDTTLSELINETNHIKEDLNSIREEIKGQKEDAKWLIGIIVTISLSILGTITGVLMKKS